MGTIIARTAASSPALISTPAAGGPTLAYAGRLPIGGAADYADPDLAELEHPPKHRR